MPNRSRRVERVKRRNNKNEFMFANDLNFIKLYSDHDICIEKFISRFGPNDIILYNKNIGFALIQYKDFRPINILDDPFCPDFIYINDNQRGKGYGKRLLSFVLKHFQIAIHTLDDSLGFFERIEKDLGLETINTGLAFGNGFNSSNSNANRQPVVNKFLGGFGLNFSGYKKYACPKFSTSFAKENLDMMLIRLNESLRSKLGNNYQPRVLTQLTGEQFLGY